jgi:hypothetical protein
MSYYPIPRRVLFKQIGLPWLRRANALRRENRLAGSLVRSDPIWSKIKTIYTDIQGKKCIFCDLQVLVRGSANADLEHFRPKGKIEVWPKAQNPAFPVPTGAKQATGYFWLAYHPLNYASSCKHCNSALKRCAFPILSVRGSVFDSIESLNISEKPLLLFPFGPSADNPENFISFNGFLAIAKSGIAKDDQHRAEATIQFFDLNHSDILKKRMEIAIDVFERCRTKLSSSGVRAKKKAEYGLNVRLHHKADQAHFANWYYKQLKDGTLADKAQAFQAYEEACRYMESIGILPI